MADGSPWQERVQSIDRAISILNCFSVDVEELSLGQIATSTGLPKPTVYRLLTAMRNHQWIEQDERSGLYRLGFRLYTLGIIAGAQSDLRKGALPVMERLAKETKETVNLNIVDDDERICIELVEGSHGIRNFVKLGTRNTLLHGASGRVLLAHLPQERIDSVLANVETAQRDNLLSEVEQIRRQGYALTYSNRVEGAFGASAPIFGHKGSCIAGLTVSGPVERIRESETMIVGALLRASHELSERMGFVEGVSRKVLP